jgi:L-aminopeptidase/D-esterase-like protein
VVEIQQNKYTIGIFVQSNFGVREELVIAGVPVGKHIKCNEIRSKPVGSIIAVAATDAPLLPHQLKRLARRVGLGMARSGGISHNGSGDIFIALSTANEITFANETKLNNASFLSNDSLDPLFEAVVQATDEAIIDSMVANQTMTGRDGITAIALPHDHVRELLTSYRVLANAESG